MKKECNRIVHVRVNVTKLGNRAIIIVQPARNRQLSEHHRERIQRAYSMIIESNKQQPVANIYESLCSVTTSAECAEIQIVFTPISGQNWSDTFNAIASRTASALRFINLRIAPGLKYTKDKRHQILHYPRDTA